MSKAEAKKAPQASDYNLVLRPIISEKTTNASAHNQVVFEVRKDATKPQIAAAVQSLFKVKVVAVNTQVRKGKTKVARGRYYFRQDMKIAYVTLAEGQSIDVSTGI